MPAAPGYPMGSDPMAIDNLYRQYMLGRLADDEEENRARTSYRDALDTLQKNRRRSLDTLSVNQADRGMTHAGASLQSGLDTNAEFDQGQTQIGQNMTSTLSRIAKKRLMDDANYNMQRTMY